jgi:hypothetical protein
MSGGLAPHGVGPIEWSESDEQPYFTDRPGWPGYSALLTWAAHAEHPDLPLPDAIPESWADDPAFQRSTRPEAETSYRTILEPQLWLPVEFPFVFAGGTLASDEPTRMGSTFTLRKQLNDLKQVADERLTSSSEFAVSAREAVERFRDLTDLACDHRLPIMLSY